MNQSQAQYPLESFGIPMSATCPAMDNSVLMADLVARTERKEAITAELLAKQPDLGYITAFIMARDLLSAERMTEAVAAGKMTASKAVNRIGSYARWQWAIDNLDRTEFFEKIADLWSGSDPDDTNPAYLTLWREAVERRGKVITDGKALPGGKKLKLYRGQSASDPLGISFSLNEDVAQGFADGAAVRRPLPDGVILRFEIAREFVLAYLTGRIEDEVIVDIEKAGLK